MVYGSPDADTAGADLDAVFAALSHPARRDVLRRLARTSHATAMNGLAAEVGISPQLLNKHAAVLERAGLISREPHGREKRVRANLDALTTAEEWLAQTSSYWQAQLDSLGQYVDSIRRADHRRTGRS